MNESPSPRPTKTVLGRGLGHLLGAERPRIEVPSRPGATQTKLPAVTPGVGALLRGGDARSDGKSQAAKDAPAMPAKSRRTLKLALVTADVLLLCLVAVLLLRGDGRPGKIEAALGALAIGVGAWLACLALLPPHDRE